MYAISLYGRENKGVWACSATLYDIDGTGGATVVATHGPQLREAKDAGDSDLMSLLTVMERYLALLEYGVHIDGTLAEQLEI